MPRITEEQKQYNHGRILRAAREGLMRYGVDGMGINEIINAAGRTNGGLYNHDGAHCNSPVLLIESPHSGSLRRMRRASLDAGGL